MEAPTDERWIALNQMTGELYVFASLEEANAKTFAMNRADEEHPAFALWHKKPGIEKAEWVGRMELTAKGYGPYTVESVRWNKKGCWDR